MKYGDVLEVAANWAAILTAVIATLAYGRFAYAKRSQRRSLEQYLREEKLSGHDEGRRTLIHLMGNLAMTEAEVLHAVFQSRKIKSVPGIDEQGRAVRLYFEYNAEDLPIQRKF